MIQTIITEKELEIIHKLIHDWYVYDFHQIATMDEVDYLKQSLPLLTRDMKVEMDDTAATSQNL